MPYQDPHYGCPVNAALHVIEGKWKAQILYLLFQGSKRFGVLQRGISGITRQMLTTQLRELERDGVIHRHVYAEIPPRVEYSLTPFGQSLKPVLQTIVQWGETYIQQQQEIQPK